MTTDRLERRLAAVLVADLVGYSRLMSADEVGTLRDLERWRGEVGVLVERGQGRLLDFSGDRFLAEFASAHRAADCALAIHRALAVDGAERPPERRLAFRMGLHVGDVLVDGDTIAGHGVNVAARLEPLAEPGGLCLSEAAHQQLCDVPGLVFDDLGEHTLKNLPRPMRVYRVRVRAGAAAASAPLPSPSRSPGGRLRSLVVLPLANLSGDAAQEYFADGMTEELISALARLGGLRVISRTSAMAYKGVRKPLPQIARELGVEGVIEGSVLREGDRVRIRVHLLDAAQDTHLWAERYERDVASVLEVQAEVARAVTEQVRAEVEAGAGDVAPRREDREVYDLCLQGRHLVAERSVSALRRARTLFERAAARDPGSLAAHEGLAMVWTVADTYGLAPPWESYPAARRAFARALELDPRSVPALTARGAIAAQVDREWAAGERDMARAAALDPSYAWARHALGYTLAAVGRLDDAIAVHEQGLAVDPMSPALNASAGFLSYYPRGRVAEAEERLRTSLRLDPGFGPGRFMLSALLAQEGRFEEALDVATGHDAAHGWRLGALAFVHGRAGRRDEAARLLDELDGIVRTTPHVNPTMAAVGWAGIRDQERVLDLLERGERERWTFTFPAATSPLWWPELRRTPRFAALLRALRIPGDDARPAIVPEAAPPRVFRKEGEFWTLEFDGATCRLADSRGMGYLARLLASPFQELPAMRLAGEEAVDAAAHAGEGLATDGGDDAGELLDRQAREEYRARAAELRGELEDAEARNDIGHAERVRTQLEFLEQELRRAVGLGGRVRRAGSRVERSRVNVTKAIRAALARIETAHPALGRHLVETVRTGTACVYHPDPRAAHPWTT